MYKKLDLIWAIVWEWHACASMLTFDWTESRQDCHQHLKWMTACDSVTFRKQQEMTFDITELHQSTLFFSADATRKSNLLIYDLDSLPLFSYLTFSLFGFFPLSQPLLFVLMILKNLLMMVGELDWRNMMKRKRVMKTLRICLISTKIVTPPLEIAHQSFSSRHLAWSHSFIHSRWGNDAILADFDQNPSLTQKY